MAIVDSAGSLRIAGNAAGWLSVPGWDELDWLWHGFSTRVGGVSLAYLADSEKKSAAGELNLGFTAQDVREHVVENRLRLVEAVTGSRSTPLVTVRQVHSRVSVLSRSVAQGLPPEADGILTREPGLLLGIQTADCIPVLVVDPVRRAVAGFHAGWRGTVERIVETGVARMVEEFGSVPGDLMAAIGPGIGSCCYAVGDAVLERFTAGFGYGRELFHEDAGQLRLDLVEANRRQLMDAGLAMGAIAGVGGCTSCQPEWFFSHRASGGVAGRMMAVVGIRAEAGR